MMLSCESFSVIHTEVNTKITSVIIPYYLKGNVAYKFPGTPEALMLTEETYCPWVQITITIQDKKGYPTDFSKCINVVLL
jgi:hypothetical protein